MKKLDSRDEGRSYLLDVLKTAAKIRDYETSTNVECNLALVEIDRKQYAVALGHIRDALESCEEGKLDRLIPHCMEKLAVWLNRQSRHREAFAILAGAVHLRSLQHTKVDQYFFEQLEGSRSALSPLEQSMASQYVKTKTSSDLLRLSRHVANGGRLEMGGS